jgi:phosphohistidine phosphatase
MLHVLIIRHAPAADPDRARWPDDRERPLTEKGADGFRNFLRSLPREQLLAPSRLWSSRLTRAWQTAGILAEEIAWPQPIEQQVLEPGISTAALHLFLQRNAVGDSVAIVGHEPDLGQLASYLLTGDAGREVVRMKKGAIADLCFEDRVEPGAATLMRLYQMS